MRHGAARGQLILLGTLAMVAAFVVFNKVGSPQFQLWLIAVVAVGLAFDRRRWTTPALLMLLISALTTLIYPVLYEGLYSLNPAVALLLTTRNLLLFAVLAWAVRGMLRLGSPSGKPQVV